MMPPLGALRMADTITLRTAIDTACIHHHSLGGADVSDRCLLERHLHGRWENREADAEDLASFGLAYLRRLPEDEC